MQKSKLIQVLKTLSKEEMRRLNKFVVSPYFNSNEHVSKLFSLLKKSYPLFSEKEIQERLLYSKLFPGSPFDIKRFRVISSRLFAVLEKFLVVENGRENSIEFQQKLTQEYGRRNLYKYFEKGIRKMDEELDKQSYQDAEYFRNKMLLNRWYFEHPATDRQSIRAQSAFNSYSRNTDAHFILRKLELSLSIQSQKLLLKQNYYLSFYEEIKQETEKSFKDIPVLMLFRNALTLQEEVDDTIFEATRTMLLERSEQLSHIDRQSIRTILSNYCIKRFRSGEEKFRQINFSLRRVALEKGWSIQNGQIGIGPFWSILVEAVNLEKFDWADSFIETYQGYLPKGKRQEITKISRAFLVFYLTDYDTVISLLSNTKTKIPFFKLIIRNLLTRTYFHLYLNDPEFETLLFSQLEADEKFAQRESTLSLKQKNHFLQFVRYTRKTAMAKNTTADLLSLRYELSKVPDFPLRNWLIDVIKNLIPVDGLQQ